MAAVESRDDSGASEHSESPQSKDSKNSASPSQGDSRSWLVGDVVWSKIPGHPWWPSMVSYDPNTAVSFKYKGRARYYHVQFFGQDPVRGWVAERSILKFEGRQHFENSFHGKQLKIAAKRVFQWETAVKVAEKAKPMNRHERQLCYTFKYYDKNDAKKLDTGKVRNLNGFSSLPEQVNGVLCGHNSLVTIGDSQSALLNVKMTNGLANGTNDCKDDGRKDGKERTQRKRKRIFITPASTTLKSSLDLSKNNEPPKRKRKRTEKQNDVLFNSSDLSDTSTDKIDIASKLDLPGSIDLNSELHENCNGFYHENLLSPSSPPRVNGDSSFGLNNDISPNTALKLKIRKIQPKANPVEGKRKRGRPRKPRFVIVSEGEDDTAHKSPNETKVKVKRVVEKKGKVESVLIKVGKDDVPKKKKQGRKPSNKAPVVKEGHVLPVDVMSSVTEKLEQKNQKEEVKYETRKEEISKANVCVEVEGSIASSSIDDDSGSTKNGATAKREKEAVCVVCEQQENLIFCEGVCGNAFHLDCIGLSVIPKGKFVCDECITGNHCCFVCRQTGNVKQCHHQLCTKHYHENCLKAFKTAKFDGDRFYCPLHFCSTCVTNKNSVTRGRMIRCVRCPTAYHLSGCLVAGCIPISSHLMVCAKHFLREKSKAHHTHVNVNWCFVCSIGGTLICCESCPAAFHPECISYEGIPEGHFFCKDCAEGKQLLYGDIVWVKLGMYRWWPAQICNPREVPTNIQNLRHQPGEFPVMFLGSHDYYWIHKGRVFSYQEGDKGSTDAGGNKHLAKIFKQALVEAKEKYAEWRAEKENKAEQDLQKMSKKPAPYKHIKVNKWTTAIRTVIDLSELPTCDCSQSSENPCGADSNCLNRMLQFECNPTKCPAKEMCQNQHFQKRQYVDCEAFRTLHRGWGLRCKEDLKKGQFVIEYVGELIDEATCQERVRKGEDITNYYMLTIDKDCIIDAGPMGNLSRFMNHSCDPNCETQKWTVNGEVRVGLFASRSIKAEEELTFDYQLDCLGNEKKKCHCGALNCSSFLGVRPKNQVQEDKLKKNPDKRKKRKVKKTIVKEVHEDECFLCGDGGELLMCDKGGCSKCYHRDCLSGEVTTRGKWICPWHFCDDCGKWATTLCSECPNSYCRTHALSQITELANGSCVCSDHIVTRKKTSNCNQVDALEMDEIEAASTDVE